MLWVADFLTLLNISERRQNLDQAEKDSMRRIIPCLPEELRKVW